MLLNGGSYVCGKGVVVMKGAVVFVLISYLEQAMEERKSRCVGRMVGGFPIWRGLKASDVRSEGNAY